MSLLRRFVQQFVRNGTDTDVKLDTTTPANNRPLPVDLYDANGQRGKTGNEFEVEVNASALPTGASTLVEQQLLYSLLNSKLNLDAFRRLMVSEPSNRFDVEFIYDTQEEIIDKVIGGNGTITHNATAGQVELSNGDQNTTDYAYIQSYPIPYTAGNSQHILMSGVLDSGQTGVGTAEVFLRSKVTGSVTEEIIPQEDWLDCTSGLDWGYSFILEINFQSLKVGNIEYYIENENGERCLIANISNVSKRVTGYWRTPSLPLSWRVYNTDTNTYCEMCYGDGNNAIGIRYKFDNIYTASMSAICGTVKSEGGVPLLDITGFTSSIIRETAKTVSTTLVPLLSIRCRSTFNSIENLGVVIPNTIEFKTDNPIRYYIYHDSVLTNASWSNVDTTHSLLEYDVSATALSNGHILQSGYVATEKNITTSFNSILGKALLWYRKSTDTGILTIAAIRDSTTDALVKCGFINNEIK